MLKVTMILAGLLVAGCTSGEDVGASPSSEAATPKSDPSPPDSKRARSLRGRLVGDIIARGDLHEGRVAQAMRRVPRHSFVPGVPLDEAYDDMPLPIGFGQTISQPTVVAIMTESLELSGSERVLEVGTGSGYQAAILGALAHEVFSIEVVPELALRSSRRLAELGFTNVHVRAGDGYLGWPEHAPFDRIIVTAAPPTLPEALFAQLADGGVLVVPVGTYEQSLLRYRKHEGGMSVEDLGPVAFVPMVHGSEGARRPSR